jgi:hypothetical protein
MLDGYNSAAANWEMDKPRHLWLLDFPAQTVVTCSQIYWSEESIFENDVYLNVFYIKKFISLDLYAELLGYES